MTRSCRPSPIPAALTLCLAGTLLALGSQRAFAQSSCSSDGQAAPRVLMERFIDADCAGCWADVDAPRAPARTLAIDWVAPGSRGDDAPLSAVAVRDALERLDALRRAPPAPTAVTSQPNRASAGRLRVANGLPFNDYIGVSAELRPAAGMMGPLTLWLVLVEDLPAGTEGSAVPRLLVRNALHVAWKRPSPATRLLTESRSMRIPEGAKPERLRVAGWVEDGRGRVGAAAVSHCE